jgi:putative ABC transport system permease protein
MNHLWQDVRYGVRMLLNKPGFTAAAMLVLALGIGANSAVFSLINAFLLRPLALERPGELRGLYSRDTKHPDNYRGFSYPNYVDVRDQNPVFSSLMAYNMAMVGLQEGDETRRVFAAIVSANFFSTLGVSLSQGRQFMAEEEKPGAELTAIVSYTLWEKRGEDPQLVGKQIRVNGHLFTVVGVTRKGFTGTTALLSPEIYLPLGANSLVMNDFDGQVKPLADRNSHVLMAVGRLKPAMTQGQADAALAVVGAQMEKAYPAENRDQTLLVRPLSRLSISTSPTDDSDIRMPAILLLSLAAVVLLIASLNLANMMMARGSARRKEISIRLAVGGGRRQIVQQLVTEGLILAVLGGVAGLLAASWSSTLLVKSLAQLAPIDVVYDSTPDVRVLAMTLFFCLLSTIVFGLFPAWKLSKPDLSLDLKEKTREDTGAHGRRLLARGNLLVMAQLALSLLMLAAAGLFVHSAVRAANVQPGFALDNQVLAEVDGSLISYDEARGSHLYSTLKDRLRQIRGVRSVAMAATVPFGTVSMGKTIARSDIAVSKQHPGLETRYNVVSEDYFDTMGIPMLRGRPFTAAESTAGAKTRVAIIDQLAAGKLWPGGDPLGKHIRTDAKAGGATVGAGGSDGAKPVTDIPELGPDVEIVGVVGNVRDNIIGGKPQGHLYFPVGQEYKANVHFHIKTAGGGPEADKRMLEAVRGEIRATDARLPLLALKTMRAHLDASADIWIVRTGAHILEIFGSVALFLAVIGLYAVNAYTVARRTREIGIRMALGADASATLSMILREGLTVTAVGVGAGMLLAMAVGQVLAGLLYDIHRFDPLVLSSAPVVLTLVAVAACYFPARRAARVDPMVALRYE